MKASAMEGASGEDSASQASDEQLVTLQIYVPELVVQKCMQFNREEIIWDVKNQILAALPKELKEGFNYGLFCPPVNGRAGRFLDEERPLADYPFTESTTYVELRYKRRIYKMSMEEKQLKQLHSRANLRRLLEHVHNSHVEKITKMCSRGLDPNFHCQDTGESPLTMATGLKHPAKVIMALVNGGAHLDFRTKDGCTVLHKAVEKNNLEALRTLLDLGSSPNYKDSRGLTTLYYSVLYNSDPQLTEMLLHDHAMIGTADPHGWQEVHQACKYGLVQHLEHLLFYGADMNARNASGNTPMHVCAVNDQESCARVLLFRGADKNALNYANQNPHQVAVIAGNLRLAEIIKNHKPEDVVPYRETPRYNPRRRTSTANMGNLGQNQSDPRLEQLVSTGRAPSPCPSNHSLPHLASGSSEGHNDSTSNEEDAAVASDAVDSSYVGANSSGTDSDPFDSAKSTPLLEAVCICVEEYNPSTSGHLQLAKGDLIEVLAVSGSGYLEGRRRDGEEGLFPAACIQEVTVQPQRCSDTIAGAGRHRSEGRRNLSAKGGDMPRKWKMFGEPRTVILHKGKKGFGFVLRGAKATSPLMERQPTEFWPSLQYLDDVDKGGVAEMAGLRKGDFLLEINGQDVSQASHEHVVAIIRQSGDLVSMTVVTVFQQQAATSHAQTEKSQMINRQCATLPRKLSTKKAPLPPKRDPKTTLSVGRARARSMVAGLAEIETEVLDHTLNEYDSEGRSTKSSSIESIPNKPSSGATPDSSTPSTTTTTPIVTTTATSSSSSSSLQHQQQQQLQHEARHPRPPQTSTTSEMQDFFARHSADHPHCAPLRNRYATVARIHKMKRRRKLSSFGHPIRDDTDFRIPKNYSSTPELMGGSLEYEEMYAHSLHSVRRSRSLGDVHLYHGRHAGRRYTKESHRKDKLLQRQHSIPETSRSHHGENQKLRERSSTPEVQGPSVIKQNGSNIYAETVPVSEKGSDKNCPRSSCPPPSYPPPPPPVGQMIKVDVSRGEYANATLGRQKKGGTIMSSFRPTDDAKLYASPDAVTVVGYKKDSHSQLCNVTLPRHFTKGNNLRSHSLPPKMPQNAKSNATTAEPGVRSAASLDTDYSSGESTTGYVPSFKTSHRSRDHQNADSTTVVDKRATLKKMKSGSGAKTTSPKQYPQHEHFIAEPDDDTSEEEDTAVTAVPDNKSGLLTFRAVENQVGTGEKSKADSNSIKVRKHGSGADSDLIKKAQKNAEKLDNKENDAEGEKSINTEVVLSEETGERIFVAEDKTQNAYPDTNEALMEKSQTKTQKIPPTPPPKKTEDHATKLTTQENVNNKHHAQHVSDKKRNSDPKSITVKESSVPFKATIILKQTEIIHKETKEITPKTRSKELIHQHSAQDLILSADTISKAKVEDASKEDIKPVAQKVKSPPQTLQKPTKHVTKTESLPQKDFNAEAVTKEKAEGINSQKVAPAVPKKPKVEEIKSIEENDTPPQQIKKSLSVDANSTEQIDDVSPSVEMSSKSVKENIYNFEKQSQLASAKVNISPRRKSDVIRITLVGSQQKAMEDNAQDKSDIIVQTMKTSKSCPKAFEEDMDADDNLQLTAMLPPDIDSQVTRFSAETPTTTTASRGFPDDWRRPGVVSPVTVPSHPENLVKRPPETAPKTTTIRKSDKENLLSRRASSNNIEVENGDMEIPPFSGAMTINRQTVKSAGNVPSMTHAENITSTSTLPRSGGLFTHTMSQPPGTPTIRDLPLSSNIPHAASTPTSRPPGTHPANMAQMAMLHNNIPTSLQQPNVPVHATRPPVASIPLVGLSQTPPVPSHASSYPISTSAPHSIESHRRNEAEYLAEASRNKEVIDQPYYVPSSSQPSKILPGPMSAQARLLDNRHFRAPPPSNRMIPSSKGCEDDVCLRLCEQVDKSLQLIRLQVDTLGMAAAGEPEVLTELVPPPPEFNFSHAHEHATHPTQGGGGQPPNSSVQIAPPPEFSDESLARQRRAQHMQGMMPPGVPQHRMIGPQATIDAPVGRRTVPPDMAAYPYSEHMYRGHVQQSPQDPRHPLMHHPHQQQQILQQQQQQLQQQKLHQQQLQQLHHQQQQKLHPQQQQFHHQLTPQQQQQLHQQQLQQQQLHQQQIHHQQQQQQLHHQQQPQQIHHPQQQQLHHQTLPHPQQQQQQLQQQHLQQQQLQQQQLHHPQSQQQQLHHPQQQQILHAQQQQKLIQQQQQLHNQQQHPQHSVPNHLTSSPIKTMTMSRGGYPSHHSQQQPQQQIRYESNCNTLPHPGARMVMLPPQQHHHPQQQQHLQQRIDPQHPFSPGRNTRDDSQSLPANIPPPPQPQKEFRQKPLHQWNMRDVSDWLESLFLPEYKICFAEAGITGSKLANMDNNDLMGLGVKQAGHRLNMERSIKWYLK